jgi:hypothetical protein
MTTAERLRGEGKKEGRIEALKETARNFLKSGFDPKTISRNTSLPLTTVLELEEEMR